MAKKTLLSVCHNHPTLRPGGAEVYAYELFQSLAGSDELDAYFLAKGGPPLGYAGNPHSGTFFSAVNQSPREYFFHTDGYDYDWLNGTMTDKDFYTVHFRAYLEALRPDIVHFQHTMFLGYDVIREVRNTLPDAVIVYTLHEYKSICHRDGQMLRTRDDQLCDESSPRRCHECFPDISPQAFFLRKRFIQSHLALVDAFVTPSHFLLERYVEWGIPRDKLVLEENGRAVSGRLANTHDRPRRDRLGFFGQISHYKGVDILLEAMRLLAVDDKEAERWAPRQSFPPERATANDGTPSVPHLSIHGANVDIQSGPYQERFRGLLAATSNNVDLCGRYERAELPTLMEDIDWVVVPSIWWENSPLVIQEAFLHGRPVICSNVGGMAEKVDDGINGIHFRMGDPRSLARAIRRAIDTDGLWEAMRLGIPPVHTLETHAKQLTELYLALLDRRQAEAAVPC